MTATSSPPLPPGSTIGILGGGQLGRMLAMAAARLGFASRIYTDKADAPATQVTPLSTRAPFDDPKALRAFAAASDVVTFEFENVPADALREIARTTPVHPPVGALEVAQDRLREKELAQRLGIGTAAFAPVDGSDDLVRAIGELGRPALLKTRRFGYDGKGQVRITDGTDPAEAYEALARAPAIVERFVAYEREISVITVRGRDGQLAFYDPAENRHENQILAETRVPARVAPDLASRALSIAESIAGHLDYVGVLCVELFVETRDGEATLLVNEIAPRVHNSGHWTIEACAVSQFENHIRAVAGWPLGSTARHSDAVMTNLIGAEANDWQRLAGETGLAVHLYGKDEARPGRKMGHTTRITPRAGE